LYCNLLTATIDSRRLELNVIEIQGEPYLSAAEACELLGVKPATLYAYVSRGVLKSYRQGIKRARLYRRGDVQRVLHLRPSRDARPLPHAADWMGDP
jgi:excisionase family DNA binding protein